MINLTKHLKLGLGFLFMFQEKFETYFETPNSGFETFRINSKLRFIENKLSLLRVMQPRTRLSEANRYSSKRWHGMPRRGNPDHRRKI